MRGIVVCFLIAALAIAAWWFGGYEVQTQHLAFSLTLLAGGLWFIESLTRGASARDFALPAITLPFIAALLLGVWHLTPDDESLAAGMQHARFSEYRAVVAEGALHVRSLYPAATRYRLAALSLAFLALMICCEPIRSRALLRLILGAISVNGLCVAVYGILRRVEGTDLIYGTLNAQAGFASFINRNQAAGFLNLSIAAAVGWLILLSREGPASRPADFETPHLASRRFSLSRFLASLTGEQILAGTCLILMAAGVLLTYSRGGIASLAISATVVSMHFTRRYGVAAACLTLILGLAIALTVHLGQWSAIQTRIETLGDPSSSWEGRLTHWKDTFGAVRDFPWFGTGWGTYAYANLPYQRHYVELWHVNADNLYFEVLVEGGVIGLGLFLLAWLLLLGATLRLMNPSAGRQAWALANVGMMALLTQAAHSATDFGLLRPSNGILFALLMGIVVGEAIYNVRLNDPGYWLAPARLPGWSRLVIAAVCISLAALGVWETYRAAQSRSAIAEVPGLDELTPNNDTIEEVDQYIESISAAVSQRPDDADARLKLAELLMHRYRLNAMNELQSQPQLISRLSDASVWNLTHPAMLQRIYMTHVAAYGEVDSVIRSNSNVIENLRSAAAELNLARRACPISRQIDYLASMLGVANDDDPYGTKSISRSLFAAPARRARLVDLGQLAWNAFDDELAVMCFQQALSLSSRGAPRVWNVLRERLDDTEIVSDVLPRRSDVYFEVLDSLVSDDPARELIVAKLAELAAASQLDQTSQGRLAELTGDIDSAIEIYKRILAEQPTDVGVRSRIIRCFVTLRDYDGALDQLRQGLSFAPDDPTLLALSDEILAQRLDRQTSP